jgi:hypothetical protein
MAEYYTLESLREQVITHNRWRVNSVFFSMGTITPSDIYDIFPSDWRYCPCKTLNLCIQRYTRVCYLRVGISTDSPADTSLFIEIIYLREAQKGIIRKNQALLNHFINNGSINLDALEIIEIN